MASAQSVNYTRARPMWNKIDLISQMFKTNRLLSNVQALSIMIFFSFFLFFPIFFQLFYICLKVRQHRSMGGGSFSFIAQ